MALKKSQLYSSLWNSCDELRGGMDASQYKDYVLVLLFIKYISDKYAPVPESASGRFRLKRMREKYEVRARPREASRSPEPPAARFRRSHPAAAARRAPPPDSRLA